MAARAAGNAPSPPRSRSATRHSPRRGRRRCAGASPSGRRSRAFVGRTRLCETRHSPVEGGAVSPGASPMRTPVTPTNRRRPCLHYSSCGRRRPATRRSRGEDPDNSSLATWRSGQPVIAPRNSRQGPQSPPSASAAGDKFGPSGTGTRAPRDGLGWRFGPDLSGTPVAEAFCDRGLRHGAPNTPEIDRRTRPSIAPASNLTSIRPTRARSPRRMNRSCSRQFSSRPGEFRAGFSPRGPNVRSRIQRRPEGSFTPAQPRPIGEGPRRLARAGAAETSRLTSIGARLSSRRRAAATGDRDS